MRARAVAVELDLRVGDVVHRDREGGETDLSIRPIWHQKAERVQAHILVCFLAYVLWKTLEQWQQRAGLGNSPRTILEELGRIQSTDVVLPLADGSRRELRLRCVVRPDKAQAMLLDRLGLRLPERLRVPSNVDEMWCRPKTLSARKASITTLQLRKLG
ncbi:MAG: hypothetical protein OZ948_15725 [Deltaproteobacteria bacterium]|nr:hypothetical protein [Deltaproteobacteria bacterium]